MPRPMKLTLNIPLSYVKEIYRHKMSLIISNKTVQIVLFANVP